MFRQCVARKVPEPRLQRHKADSVVNQQGNSKLPTKRSARMTVAGGALGVAEKEKENVNLSASVGPLGRRLRSRGSD